MSAVFVVTLDNFFYNYLLISFSHCPWFIETEAILSISCQTWVHFWIL